MSIKMLTKTSEGVTQDLGNAIIKAVWSGKREGAPRKLLFNTFPSKTLIIENGQPITFYSGENPLFAGYIFKNKSDDNASYALTVYDQIIYMIKNKEVYLFSDKKASDVLVTIGQDFGLNVSDNLLDTQYVIKTIIQENKKLYDILQYALDETFEQTGLKYYIRDNIGELELVDTFIEINIPDNYIISVPVEKSIEDTATRVRTVVRNKDVRTSVIDNNTELQSRWGILQLYEVLDKDINFAQQVERTKEILIEKSVEQETVKLECIGIENAISGNSVNINGVGKFFIEADVHTFSGDVHTMKLTLKRR